MDARPTRSGKLTFLQKDGQPFQGRLKVPPRSMSAGKIDYRPEDGDFWCCGGHVYGSRVACLVCGRDIEGKLVPAGARGWRCRVCAQVNAPWDTRCRSRVDKFNDQGQVTETRSCGHLRAMVECALGEVVRAKDWGCLDCRNFLVIQGRPAVWRANFSSQTTCLWCGCPRPRAAPLRSEESGPDEVWEEWPGANFRPDEGRF